MRGRMLISAMFAVLAASLVFSSPVTADDDDGGKKKGKKAGIEKAEPIKVKPGKPDKPDKPTKPVRVKAPPKPSVQTVVAPGTWKVHRHRGNSPLFKPGREKDWAKPGGPGKPGKPVVLEPKPRKPGKVKHGDN